MIGDWLSLLCAMLPGVQRAAVLSLPSGHALATWPSATIATNDLEQAARLALSRTAPTVCMPATESGAMLAARPLTLADQNGAVIALELTAGPAQQAAVLRLLDWGQAWLSLLQRDAAPAPCDTEAEVLKPLQAALAADAGHAAAALATELARQQGLQRACLGRLQRGRVRIAGASFSDGIGSRTTLAQQLAACMEEALQQGHTLHCQRGDPACPDAHAALLRTDNCASILSVPLRVDGALCGVLLCTQHTAAFSPGAIRDCEALAGLAGPLLRQRRTRLIPGVRRPLSTRLALAGAALLALALLPGPHRVAAPARVEGRIQRAIVAPVDGYLLSAPVRAGASIRQGDLIATLDDHEMRLERQRWEGQREEYRRQYSRDLAELNHSQMRIAQSQVTQAQARLDLLEDKLSRLRITAPIDGVIIKGDLSRAVGTPVKRGEVLFELAPLGQYRLILDVPESDVTYLRAGQRGRLSLSSLPDTPIDFTVEQVSPVYSEHEGEITYRTEARIDAGLEAMRPGMSGLGKIQIGERSYLWLATHKMFDWLRLKLWSLLP